MAFPPEILVTDCVLTQVRHWLLLWLRQPLAQGGDGLGYPAAIVFSPHHSPHLHVYSTVQRRKRQLHDVAVSHYSILMYAPQWAHL
jgi:hypothetical protein